MADGFLGGVKELAGRIRGQEGEFMDDDLEFLERKLEKFPAYVDAVYGMEARMPIIQARYEGQELRDAITALDRRRHDMHEAAIDACRGINRLAGAYGMEPICIESEDRYEVADFVGMAVSEVYNLGIDKARGRAMDQAVTAMDGPLSGRAAEEGGLLGLISQMEAEAEEEARGGVPDAQKAAALGGCGR